MERYERVNLKDTDNCVESKWGLRYMCESISTSKKAGMDQAMLPLSSNGERGAG